MKSHAGLEARSDRRERRLGRLLSVRTLVAACVAAFGLVGTGLTAPFAPTTQVQPPGSAEISGDFWIALATWVLAIGTFGLCVVTARIGRKQSEDSAKSVEAAQRAAEAAARSANQAAHQWRDSLVREVNVTAHRVGANAMHIKQIAIEILAQLEPSDPAVVAAGQQRDIAQAVAATASTVAFSDIANRTDDDLKKELRTLDEHRAHLEVMKEAVLAQLEELESQTKLRREQLTAIGKTKTLVAARLVSIALALIGTKKLADAALVTQTQAGAAEFLGTLPEGTGLLRDLGTDLLVLDAADIDALETLQSNLEISYRTLREQANSTSPTLGNLRIQGMAGGLGHTMGILAECFDRIAPSRLFIMDGKTEQASAILRRTAKMPGEK